jgi:type II secretory pathway pseudopilin PulG
MLSRLQERRGALKDESGFTQIEFLVVLITIGFLLAIAIPSYLGESHLRCVRGNVTSWRRDWPERASS